jgi:hypothetical protein
VVGLARAAVGFAFFALALSLSLLPLSLSPRPPPPPGLPPGRSARWWHCRRRGGEGMPWGGGRARVCARSRWGAACRRSKTKKWSGGGRGGSPFTRREPSSTHGTRAAAPAHTLVLALTPSPMENHLLRHGEAMEAELKAAGEVSLGVRLLGGGVDSFLFLRGRRACVRATTSCSRAPGHAGVYRACVHRPPRRAWPGPKRSTPPLTRPPQCPGTPPPPIRISPLSPARPPSWPSPTTAASSWARTPGRRRGRTWPTGRRTS